MRPPLLITGPKGGQIGGILDGVWSRCDGGVVCCHGCFSVVGCGLGVKRGAWSRVGVWSVVMAVAML